MDKKNGCCLWEVVGFSMFLYLIIPKQKAKKSDSFSFVIHGMGIKSKKK